MDKEGAAALYYRCAGEEFSGHRKLEQPTAIDLDPQTLTFRIGCDSRLIEAIDFHPLARLPGEPIAYMKIHSVDIEAEGSDPGTTTSLLSACGHAELNRAFTWTGLKFNDRLLGALYAVEGRDPGMQYRVPPLPEMVAGSTLRFQFVLEYIPGKGYIMARDEFLARQEWLEEHVRGLETRIVELEDSRRELERYRRSPLWGGFVRTQSLYDRLLGAGRQGAIGTSLKVFSPGWWSRRRLNEYERWRTVRGYRNRPDE